MTSSIPRERLLRRLEQTSHLATTAAFLLTILLVTTGYASELNLVAATLFSEVGWAAAGVAAIAVITAAFAFYERHVDTHPRLILGAAVLVTMVSGADLGVNLYVLAVAGWPETIHTAAYGPSAALVATAGLLAIGRRQLRAVGCGLRQHSPSAQQSAAVAFALLLVVSGVGPFASFGGLVVEDHDGTASAAEGDVDWSSTTSSGVVVSSPTIVDGTVYVGTGNNTTVAYDAATGDQEWSYSTGASVDKAPLVTDGTVYVGTGDGTLHAIDASTGTGEWTYATNGGAIEGSPTAVNGTVYVTSRDNYMLHAVDASTGTEEWNYTVSNQVHASPTVAGGSVYITQMEGVNVHSVDAETGTKEWSTDIATNRVFASATVANGKVYVGSNDNQLNQLDAETGNIDWTYSTGASIDSVPTVADGTVFIGSSDGVFHAVDNSTGNGEWTFTATSGTAITSSPTVAAGTVYFGSNDNNLHALDADTGSEQWSYTAGNAFEDSSPTVADGSVFVGNTDGNLYSLDTGDAGAFSEGSRVNLRTLGHHDQTRFDGPPPDAPTGQALDQNGDPVANATVVASYDGKDVNEVLLDGEPYDELQNDPTKNLDAWQGQMDNLSVEDPSDAGVSEWYDHLEQKNDARVVSHTAEDWNKEGINVDFLVPDPTFESGQELPTVTLREPTVVYEADETVVLSTWEGTGTSLATQDGLDQQLPGETTPSNITVERVDPLGDAIWSETYQTRAVYENRHQGNIGWSDDTGVAVKEHHAAIADLDPGMYRASPEGSEITTVFVVTEDGDLDGFEAEIENWAANQSESVSEFNDRARDKYSNLPVETTQTNETGHYTLNPPSTAESVDITVTKTGAEGVVNDPTSVTKEDLRNEIETQTEANWNDEVSTVDFQAAFDARNTDDTFQRACRDMDSVAGDVGAPYYGDKQDVAVSGGNFDVEGDRILTDGLDPAAQQCAAINLAEGLLNDNLAGVLPAFLDADGWAEKAEALLPLLDTNDALKEAVEDATGITIDSPDPDDYSDQQLQDLVSEGGETVDEYADGGGTGGADPGSGGGLPTGDDGTTAPSVGDGDTDVDEQAETLTEEWPVEGVSDWSNAEVMVRIHFSDGNTTALGTNSSYVEIEENGFGSDTVRLENYPLNASDPPVARTKLTVVSQSGVGNSPDTPDSVVRNPTFDGDIPRLQSVQVPTMTPQAGSDMTVGVTPADAARFGSLESISVDGPNCQQTVTPDGDEATVPTCDEAGDNRVTVTYSNTGNTTFSETFVVTTTRTAQSRPASVRGMAGVTGRFVLASSGLQGGRMEVKNGASEIELVAIAEPDSVPNQYSAYATGLDTPKDADVSTRIVAGDSEQTVRERVGVTLHSSRPSNSTLYYRNGAPIPAEEEHAQGRLRFDDDQVVYSTFTDDSGRMELRVNQDPGFVERVTHWIGTTSFSPLSLGGDLLLVGSPGVVLLWRRRRRPPNGGTQQEAKA